MNKIYSRLLLLLLCIVSTVAIKAQDNTAKSSFDVSGDIVSRYIWRGIDLGNAPSIQPGLSFTGGKNLSNLEIGVWGSYDFNGNFQESDIYVSYTINEIFTATITDYYFPGANNQNYFEYNSDSTGHVFEGTLAFNGTDKFPLNVAVSYDFYGADKSNSMYAEISYPTSLHGIDVTPFAGASIVTRDEFNDEPTSYYYCTKEKFGLINVGATISKEVKITDSYSMPIFGSVIFNPDSESMFIVLGLSL